MQHLLFHHCPQQSPTPSLLQRSLGSTGAQQHDGRIWVGWRVAYTLLIAITADLRNYFLILL